VRVQPNQQSPTPLHPSSRPAFHHPSTTTHPSDPRPARVSRTSYTYRKWFSKSQARGKAPQRSPASLMP
jgi:hypothetical protein